MRKQAITATLVLVLIASAAIPLLAQSTQPAQQQPQTLKITQGPKVESSTGNDAIIAWSTNVAASTVVRYGTDPKNLDQTAEAPWGGLTHRVTLTNLHPNTTYYYRVDSGQGQGIGGNISSEVQQFHTSNATPTAK